jgi:cyclic pyranopterin phosphate synthase
MVQYCQDNDFTLRLIETMPLGSTGQTAFQKKILSFSDIKQQLASRFPFIPGTMPGGGPARYIQLTESQTRIGFITPISQHFCETCNRVRLSAEGTIYTCLGQEHNYPLRPLIRSNASDEQLKEAIQTAINLKPEKHEFNEKPLKLTRIMSKTGG